MFGSQAQRRARPNPGAGNGSAKPVTCSAPLSPSPTSPSNGEESHTSGEKEKEKKRRRGKEGGRSKQPRMAVMSAKRSLTWWRNIARPILSEATPLSHCARSHTRRASSGCRLESQNELNGPRKGDTGKSSLSIPCHVRLRKLEVDAVTYCRLFLAVVVAMSGGVDSSVAALLMAQQVGFHAI